MTIHRDVQRRSNFNYTGKRRFDTLRWAIDRYPAGIAYYADVARRVLDYTLQLR